VEVRFGPAGKPIGLKSKELKDIPPFLKQCKLNAMEYEAVRSVKISEDKARSLGKLAKEYDILLSLHAPYALNLVSMDEEKVKGSINRLLLAVKAAYWMGAYRVVFHPGYYGDLEPKEALRKVIDALSEVVEKLREERIKGPILSPETTGKVKQVGSLEEVVEMAKALGTKYCIPTIDFAHIYARTCGEKLRSVSEFVEVLEYVEDELGSVAVSPLHVHFSEIEYGQGGELRHHPIGSGYGPKFEQLADALIEVGYSAVIISESPLLEEDAIKMRDILFSRLKLKEG